MVGMRTTGTFFNKVIQTVFRFGSETWVETPALDGQWGIPPQGVPPDDRQVKSESTLCKLVVPPLGRVDKVISVGRGGGIHHLEA